MIRPLCALMTEFRFSLRPRTAELASGGRRLRLRPDGGQEQSYSDTHGNFEEPMDGDHPCRFGTRYEHDDG
jgi:hypothetical protein